MHQSPSARRQATLLEKIAASLAMLAIVMLSVPPQAYADDVPVSAAPQVTTDSTTPAAGDVQSPDPSQVQTPDQTKTDESLVPSVGDLIAPLTTLINPVKDEGNCIVVIDGQSHEFANSDPHCTGNWPQGGQTCTLHSDSATTFNGSASVPVSPIHSAWTALTHGATWIWGENPIANAENASTETFTKTFTLTTLPSSGSLEIAADNSYSVTLNGNPLTSDSSEQNYTAAGQDTINIPFGSLVVGVNTLTFTVNNFAQSGGTMASNPAGLLYTVTLHDAGCTTPPPPQKVPTMVLIGSKVVCDDESLLPNWGQGGHGPITATTATDYVAAHPGCHMASGWSFEAGNSSAPDMGDAFIGEASWPHNYTAWGPTDATGKVQTEIPISYAGNELHVREVLQPGYIPFTHGAHPDNSDNVSAEFYCANDALNYDNFDFIRNPEAGVTYYCVGFNALKVPVTPKTSTVTMCKYDDQQHPLSGWTLSLKGDHVGSATVNPNGSTYSVANVPAGSYIVTATGAYIYRPGEVNASTSDAAFSLRAPGDGYSGPYAPWIEENTFAGPYTGWLGVMLNNSLTNWGHVFHPDHVYALGTTTASTQNLDFKILDDQYGDNSGSVQVDVDHGYVGVTGENGCVTFNNVPQGSYTAGELNQPGWSNVSGLGPVTVGSEGNTFNVVNHNVSQPPVKYKVHVFKYLDNGESFAQIPNDSSAPQFPMLATYSIAGVGTNLNPGDGYVLGNGGGAAGSDDGLLFAANTIPLSAGDTYGTHEVTGGNSPVVTNVDSCSPGKYLLEGYKTGDTLSAAQAAAISTTAPNYPSISKDQYVIVVNKACANGGGGDTKGTLTIIKKTTGGDGGFDFSVTSNAQVSPSSVVHVQTSQGTGQNSTDLGNGTYNVTETVPAGWTFTGVSCKYDGEAIGNTITNGETIVITNGSDITCTFTNTKNGEPTNTENTIVVRAADLETQNHAGAVLSGSKKWFFYNDNTDVIDNSLGSFVTGPSTPPIGTGSAEVALTATNNRTNLATFAFSGKTLASISTLKYSAYSHSGTAGPNESPYLVMNVDFNGTGTFQKRMVYVPANNGAVPQDGWNSYNAINGGAALWVYSGATWPGTATPGTTPRTWTDILTSYPGIRILPTDGHVGVRVGEPGPTGYTADIDKFVIGITTGVDTTTTTYDFEPTAITPSDTTGGGGGGGGRSRRNGSSSGGGQVLGASTTTEPVGQVLGASCGILLPNFLKIGWKNNAHEVMDLQTFLNGEIAAMLPVTGFFGKLTDTAVRAFQVKYSGNVLTPWIGHTDSGISSATDSTGYVYKSTQWKINMIHCPELNLPFPTLE